MKLSHCLPISALMLAGFQAATAAVTLTFDADLQGFVPANFGGTNNNSSVTWDAGGGNGRMKITNSNATGSRFAWITKYFTNSGQSGAQLAIYNELTSAIANGGTISYDVIVETPHFTGTAPGFFQVNLFADNQVGGFDQEYDVPGTVTVPSVTNYSIQIQTAGARVNNDDLASFLGSTGNLQFGFGSNYSNSDSLTYYVDNFTVTAVPEPSSLLAACGLFGVALLRRRR